MNHVSIYVAAHSPSQMPEDAGYVPIHVGKALSHEDFGMKGDDVGDNISSLNSSFCELTALYWMWKNDDLSHFLGLVHYRRYFAHRAHDVELKSQKIASSDDFSELNEGVDLIVGELIGLLNENGQISLEQNYFGTAIGQDLYLARSAVEEFSPEYLRAFDFTMRNCQILPYNMLVGKSMVVKAYAGWLFPILFCLLKQIPFETYNSYQGRVFGFLAERLFTVWYTYNRSKYRIALRPVVFVG